MINKSNTDTGQYARIRKHKHFLTRVNKDFRTSKYLRICKFDQNSERERRRENISRGKKKINIYIRDKK